MRLREIGREVTLFGETDEERYNRLMTYEERRSADFRKGPQAETASSFMPKTSDLEQISLIKK